MIHRAILGSFERFIGILIEHYGGEMPLWLAPEQMRILTISEKTNDYAQKLFSRLKSAGLRCGIDISDEKIGAKILRAHNEKIPYMLVVGPKEAESDSINVRIRRSKDTKTQQTDVFIAEAKNKIAEKSRDLNL
jgi:threonyl-tRNA synthetase